MKLFKIFVVMIVSLVSNIFLQANVLALEKETHYFLNEKIVVGTNLDNYLKTNLGLTNGIKEEFKGKQVLEWVKEGGKYEDEPMYTRSLNHFHNPLKTWDTAGFKGTFSSSVIWAQEQGTFGSIWGGDWSWKKARDSFYKGLTGVTKTDRENNIADTFRAIGQVMHLVEDVSVPAHTRNDAHVIGYHYELAVDKFRTKGDPVFTNAIVNPITFDSSILSLPPNAVAPIPIAKIFDIDIYNSVNPDPNVTASSAIGLSEYTNANFVSEGLLSANFQDFPFPRIEDTTIVEKSYTGSFGTYMRQYYKKTCCGETNEGQGYLLSAVDYLDYWRQKFPILSIGLPKIPVLDDNVYKDYASLLIPRAVGYSAGLLNYFFRGDLNLVADDATGSGYVIENKTNEDMEGTFELWYDDTTDNRKMIWNGYLSIAPNGKSSNITFTKPTDAKESCKYVLVLNKGTMGHEQGAVVGKVVYTTENCSSLTIVDEDGTPATDTILRNGTLDFKTTDGCCGDIVWSVSVEAGSTLGGSTITQAGVLTAGSTSCGSLKVTATCSACGTSATQDVRVTDGGRWVLILIETSPSWYAVHDCAICAGAVGIKIAGHLMYYDYYGFVTDFPTSLPLWPCSRPTGFSPNTELLFPNLCSDFLESQINVDTIVYRHEIYEWQCP